MFKIPIFRLKFENSFIRDFQRGSEKILLSDALGESVYVRQFEKDFSKLVHAKHSVAVTSGTAAIEVALRAVDVRGKVVLMPTNTFFATSVAATNAGAILDFLDIEPETLSIDPDALEESIRKHGAKKIGAVIVVHIGGIISRHIKRLASICRRHRIPLIEDAAHAQTSARDGEYAGSIGAIGCFSFFPTKVMTTGEGGMVTTADDNLLARIKSLKDFGRPPHDGNLCVLEQGSNYKVSEFMGLFGVLECKRVKERVKRRNALLKRYIRNLKSSGYEPVLQTEGNCSYYKCILRTPPHLKRDWLKAYCKERSITLTGEVYRIPLHRQPLYQDAFSKKTFPVTDAFADHHICPPLYPELSDAEVDYVCDTLLQALKV